MRTHWLVVMTVAIFASSYPHAQTKFVEKGVVRSSWSGLGTPRSSELKIEHKENDYLVNGHHVKTDLVQALLIAIQESHIAEPSPRNLGVTAEWLEKHVDEGGKNATYVDYGSGTIEQKKLFRDAFTDERTIQSRLNALYRSFHTDDYPHIRIDLVLNDGTTVVASSDSQHPFMLPWSVEEGNGRIETYNAHISQALMMWLPRDFANRESLTSGDPYVNGLTEELGGMAGSEIRIRWETLGAHSKAGDALTSLSKFYEVRRSEVNSYHHLEYGKEWKGGNPQEENLHVDLWRTGFPKGLELNAVLLRKEGKVEGASLLPERVKIYEQLVLSIDWLTKYLNDHPNQHVKLFYVHDRSMNEKAMRIFAADMKRAGRGDIVSKVRQAQDKVALFETSDLESSLEYGNGDYWIALPDKSVILWRSQSLSHVLLWKPSRFPVKDCTDYGTVTGGCSGALISPDGEIQP